ncbi:unnamed protein product [Ectocarpus sp. CCAP 1310/34]|nr:unnamed protein product [Ectocarpus sp. CCAP 1310/34]
MHDIAFDLHNPGWTPEAIDRLADALVEYSDVFSTSKTDFGSCTIMPFTLSVPAGTKPVASRPYRLIQHSTSPWASPLVVIPKKDGSVRITVNYKRLNALVDLDGQPLPRVDGILDSLYTGKVFSIFDLDSAFHQIVCDEDTVPLTAFCTPTQLFEWLRMPQGANASPSWFVKVINRVVHGLERVLAYLDDVICFDEEPLGHVLNLIEFFKRLRQYNLKLFPGKARVGATHANFLLHTISPAGLRSLLGGLSYYRKFLKNLATKVRPLNSLLIQGVPFKYTPGMIKVVKTLLSELARPPILVFPDWAAIEDNSRPLRLCSDACIDGFGASLEQEQLDGSVRPIVYISRATLPAERNWTVLDLEAGGIVWAIKRLRGYLWSTKFIIYSDHKALESIGKVGEHNARVQRWLELLSNFTYTLKYRKCSANGNAHFLSRLPLPAQDTDKTGPDCIDGVDQAGVFLIWACMRNYHSSSTPEVGLGGLRPPCTAGVFSPPALQPSDFGEFYRHHPRRTTRLPDTGVPRVYVPMLMRPWVLHACHTAASFHLGVHRTQRLLERFYWWIGLDRSVRWWLRACLVCQARKTSRQTARWPVIAMPLPQGPGTVVGVDYFGPLPVTAKGNSYILLFTDRFSRRADMFAVTAAEFTARGTAHIFVNQYMTKWGCPTTLLSDNGLHFCSKLSMAIYEVMKIKKVTTSSYHPQTNGGTERVNHTMAQMLAVVVNEQKTDWDIHLPHVEFAYNNSVNQSTGLVPNEIHIGRIPRLPLSVFDRPTVGGHQSLARDQLEYCNLVVDRQRRAYELVREYNALKISRVERRNSSLLDAIHKLPQFTVGGWAWVYNTAATIRQGVQKDTDQEVLKAKFALSWTGPYKVLAVGPTSADATPDGRPLARKLLYLDLPSDLSGPAARCRVSVLRCKPCRYPYETDDLPQSLPAELSHFVLHSFGDKCPPFPVTVDDVSVPVGRLEVDYISGHQLVRGRSGVLAVLYQTHWVGLTTPSWEGESDLDQFRRRIILNWSREACQSKQGNCTYRVARTRAAQRELARNRGERFLPPGADLVLNVTWLRRFSTSPLPVGARLWYKARDGLWWTGGESDLDQFRRRIILNWSREACQSKQGNCTYRVARTRAAQRELARNRGERFLPPGADLVLNVTWLRRFSTSPLPVGARLWYKARDGLWWTGRIGAHQGGSCIVRFLDDPGPSVLPLPAHLFSTALDAVCGSWF